MIKNDEEEAEPRIAQERVPSKTKDRGKKTRLAGVFLQERGEKTGMSRFRPDMAPCTPGLKLKRPSKAYKKKRRREKESKLNEGNNSETALK